MRVTESMISNQVVFNIQRQIERLLKVQTSISSGRRIEKPSDDPVGVLRDLDYRGELAKNEQFLKNIIRARSKAGNYDSILNEIGNLLSSVNELAVGMANGNFDSNARKVSGLEVKSVFDQIMQLANNKLEGQNVFSGFKTNTDSLSASSNGVIYNGDDGVIQSAIEQSSRVKINLNGNDVFLKSFDILGSKSDLNIAVVPTTQIADLHSGLGIDQAPGTFTITDSNLNITSTIDISGATSVADILATINAQLAADGITNVTAKIGEENNNILLDVDDTAPKQISDFTSLSKLNSGLGVDLNYGRIRLSNSSGIDMEIDLSTAKTIGDVRALFDAQTAAYGAPLDNVTMQINPAGTGLQITDTNGPALDLNISESSSSYNTANNLGILGNVGSLMIGADIQPEYNFDIAETTGTTAADIGFGGNYISDMVGNDLDTKLTATSNIADLNNGLGLSSGEIKITQGETIRFLDFGQIGITTIQDVLDLINNSGLTVTASINADGTGIQIANDDPNRSFTIEERGNDRVAKDMDIYGSSDMMGSLLVLMNALESNDQEGTGRLLANMDSSIQHLLTQRSIMSATSLRLQRTQFRLVDLELNFTALLSEVEDADITKMITDLATIENSYQASLLAGARIIQPSLMNFLR